MRTPRLRVRHDGPGRVSQGQSYGTTTDPRPVLRRLEIPANRGKFEPNGSVCATTRSSAPAFALHAPHGGPSEGPLRSRADFRADRARSPTPRRRTRRSPRHRARRWPAGRRDGLADGVGPCPLDLREQGRGASDRARASTAMPAGEGRAGSRRTRLLEDRPVAIATRTTSARSAPAHARGSVVVITLCPPERSSSTRRSRRSASSSDITSSSSISGVASGGWRRAPRAPPAAARAGRGAAGPGSRRARSSRPARFSTRSSRWGPWPLKPRATVGVAALAQLLDELSVLVAFERGR